MDDRVMNIAREALMQALTAARAKSANDGVSIIAREIETAEKRALEAAARFLLECGDHGDRAKADAIRALSLKPSEPRHE